MKRRALVVVEERRAELETCSYCPKLCRSACPVAEVEARETVTPWGMMRGTFDVARAATPLTAERAELAWACAGCRRCKEWCDHRNPVRETLLAARRDYVRRGVAPAASERVRLGHAGRVAGAALRARELGQGASPRAATALVVGCEYLLRLPDEARDVLHAARVLGEVRVAAGCCGLPLELAGDPEGAARSRQTLLGEIGDARRVVVADAGCAEALASSGAESLYTALAGVLGRRGEAPYGEQTLRYHDPCSLGRGLGVYDEPRALLALATERAAEFRDRREQAFCSGGGGLLPETHPETSLGMARLLVAEHERLGGGTIVTACAASLRRLRAAGAAALDLGSVARRLVEGNA